MEGGGTSSPGHNIGLERVQRASKHREGSGGKVCVSPPALLCPLSLSGNVNLDV